MVLIMFKKKKDEENALNTLWEKIEYRLNGIKADCISIGNNITTISGSISHLPKIESQQKTIESQQRTIEQLTNALQDKYEHGLFIFSEDGKIPVVIRNGQRVLNGLTKSFSVDWTWGEFPNIVIEQIAGTFSDSEV